LIVEAYGGSPAEWNQFIRTQPGWTLFHDYRWRGIIRDTFGHECPYVCARDGSGELQAVLPLARVKSCVFGHYLVSLPFVNYGGPLGTPEGVRAVVEHVKKSARDARVDLLELRSPRELDVNLAASHRKITVVLDLPEGASGAAWDALPSKVRSQVRRPMKAGVQVRFGLDQREVFYEVFARHMHDLGTPVQSPRLFQAIANVFPEDVWFGCAYLEGRPVAAGCGFHWGDEFEMTWASALSEHNQIAPNMLLYWSFMERCAQRGIRTFNFGRCTPGSGTHRFKLQWGSRDVPLWWYYQKSGSRSATPSPHDKAYALGPRIWRRLPLAFANRFGPRVVRHIP
jgi:FemAB-related protein (PEP-CTERM system-associated)